MTAEHRTYLQADTLGLDKLPVTGGSKMEGAAIKSCNVPNDVEGFTHSKRRVNPCVMPPTPPVCSLLVFVEATPPDAGKSQRPSNILRA